ASNTAVGGTTATRRNVIAGSVVNFPDVVVENGATGTRLVGNYIGVDPSGTAALGSSVGVEVRSGVSGSLVSGNVVSGNGTGIVLGGVRNTAAGNRIGTDASGATAIPNGIGVSVQGTADVVTGNLISGNTTAGVELSGAVHSIVAGNSIGLVAGGNAALPNGTGVLVDAQAAGNTIGGFATAAANTIAGNNGAGVSFAGAGTTGNLVSGNRIGTDAAGSPGLGNGGDGIAFGSGAAGNVVGGAKTATANTIAFNGGAGVRVDGGSPAGERIEGNSIFGNGGPGGNGGSGITLANSGNDAQLSPSITSVATNGTGTTIGLQLLTPRAASFRFEVFLTPTCGPGEGRVFLGTRTVKSGAANITSTSLTVPVQPPNDWLTAT